MNNSDSKAAKGYTRRASFKMAAGLAALTPFIGADGRTASAVPAAGKDLERWLFETSRESLSHEERTGLRKAIGHKF